MSVSITGPAAANFARGKEFFYQRRGRLDLICARRSMEPSALSLRSQARRNMSTRSFTSAGAVAIDPSRRRVFAVGDASVSGETEWMPIARMMERQRPGQS